MAVADTVAGAPNSATPPGERLQMSNGIPTDKLAPELPVLESNMSEAVQINRTADNGNLSIYYTPDGPIQESGYHSEGYNPSVIGLEDGIGLEGSTYQGVPVENGQHMYYTSGYGYPPQPPYFAQSPGPFISSGAPGYAPQLYGHVYQQVPSSSMMHYYASSPVPLGQEGPRSKKYNSNEGGPARKAKQGGGGRQGQQVGFRDGLPNQWGGFPAGPNAGYYGPPGYDYYSSQWHSSGGGFQQAQNVGLSPSYTPPAVCGRYQGFPRVQSAPNMAGKGGLKVTSGKPGVANSGANWRAKDVTKHANKVDGQANVSSVSPDVSSEPIHKYYQSKGKVQQPAALHACEGAPFPNDAGGNETSSVKRSDFNKEDFQTTYEVAKFFIIKSYSEDDVHKSMKYGVWSSTPNGNKRLDEAYRSAQEMAESHSATCPVFFFFSVNSSGQFCGVAEMLGPVDFNKDMDFWLQGKWSGCLPVKWHIIKDVPNGHFRHIILANNENKPVTHSRDTQEVPHEQGLEMLKIFKNFAARTSLLDDFAFYDDRQRVLQERKLRQQQQIIKPIKHRAFEKKCAVSGPSAHDDKENGKPGEVKEPDMKVTSIECKLGDLHLTHEPDCGRVVALDNGDAADSQPKSSVDSLVSKSSPKLEPQSSTEGKEDLATRTVIDYRKALLDGKQGKANVIDQPMGV